jgi:putative transposase
MPKNLKRYYGSGDFHFVTFSCDQQQPLLNSPECKDLFLNVLEQVRKRYELVVLGYVLMPEHVHLLLSEPKRKNLSVALQALKQVVSRKAPGKVIGKAFWEERGHDFNVFTEAKRNEKLKYIHRNPVRRGLVDNPEDWIWSSYRYYSLGEKGPVEVDASWVKRWMAEKKPTLRKSAKDGAPPDKQDSKKKQNGPDASRRGRSHCNEAML